MVSTINDDPFSLEAMYQPYDFFARLRDWEPVHYNELFKTDPAGNTRCGWSPR
jgi:hypothetical protein